MTSPQDPSQPVQPGQPGTPEPGGPIPQVWGQSPEGGALPPAGTPGWGAPPPAGPAGWSPQPGWGQPPSPNRSFASRHGCLLAFVIVLAVIAVGVGGCVFYVGPAIMMDIKLYQDLGTDRVQSVEFNTGTWIIKVRPGHESEATYLACQIVRKDLQGTQWANSSFKIVDSHGTVLASDQTPCT